VTAQPRGDDAVGRARAWRHAAHAAICDTLAPWPHGTVVRAVRYPSYWDFNLVRVEDDPPMGVDDLAGFADEALAGLAHRRVDVEVIAAAERLRPGFAAKGWRSLRLVWMRHEAPPPPGAHTPVEEVPYDAVQDLRVAWHEEDFAGQDAASYHTQAREVALRRNVQVLAVHERGAPVAFAHIERDGPAAEITQVYVHPEHRGAGRGTAMTRAAIAAAGDVEDLWIVADDEDRPKELYRRLGFRPVWTAMEFTRMPGGPAATSGHRQDR
jgi:ribosomal protein S18 acetylase RimI-like enzyme